MLLSRVLVSVAILHGLSLSYAPHAFPADLAAGKKKAMQCAVCHGRNGVAVNPEAPNLAGESSIYIEKQLKAFRSGERSHQQMTIIAKTLTDEEIENLAAWFSAMKVSVELPEVQ